MVRKGNPKNIQAIDDVCGVRAVAGLGTVEEAMFRGLSDKCVAGGKPPLEIVTCPPPPYSTRSGCQTPAISRCLRQSMPPIPRLFVSLLLGRVL
jgi:hypothetical protein